MSATSMIASRSMRSAPRTDCSASMLWGGRRSRDTRTPDAVGWTAYRGGGPPWPPRGCPRTRDDIPSGDGVFGGKRGKPVDGPGSARSFRSAGPIQGAGGAGRSRSVEAADHPDELALDSHGLVVLWRISGVRRLEPNATILLEEPLERHRVLLDLGDDDVSVPGRLLGADHDVVAVRDQRLDHGVPADAQQVGCLLYTSDAA